MPNDTIPTARLEEIREEMSGLLSDIADGSLQDGPGALAAFYNSLSITEGLEMASELIERRNKDAEHAEA